MNTLYKINDNEYTRYSYENILAKLSGYIREGLEIRVINSFSYKDPGRNTANLAIVKQFGVVPMELNSRDGGLKTDELEKIEPYDGITIMIESIYLPDEELRTGITMNINGVITNIRESDNIQCTMDVKHYSPTEKNSSALNRHTQSMTKYLNTISHRLSGGYIYISGFSINTSRKNNKKMQMTYYLPCYLDVVNTPGAPGVILKPDLGQFLKNINGKKPLITNLDDLLTDIDTKNIY